MGLFDGLSAAFGDNESGGMGGMMEHLAANGLAEHVAAWAGGSNLPISADQLRDALGNEQVQQMAGAAGQPAEDFLKALSDHLSTNGATAPSDDSDGQ
jgi:uncharacterized protein YidB (DUF937 family)